MKNLLFITVLVLLFSQCNFAQNNNEKENWEQLFNGKDLTDWDIKITNHDLNDNYKNTFRVENGILKISYDQYEKFDDKFGHMYYKKPYSFYKIRFVYRFTGEQLEGGAEWNVRNSGIMFHSQSAQSMAKDQEFPASLEIQLLGGLGEGERTTANLCTPGTTVEMEGKLNLNHCINSSSKTYHGDQWVQVSAIVLGDSTISHLVEGETVLSYQKPRLGDDSGKNPGQRLKEGYIAVQAESHPIEFKNIEVLNLKGCMNKNCKNYKSYYIEPDKCICN